MFNKNINKINAANSKFSIFKIDNFLDEKLYQELKDNFPNIDTKILQLNDNFGKKAFKKDKLINLEDKQRIVIQKFDDLVHSNEFFNFFVKKFFFKNVSNQNNFLRKLRYLRFPIKNKDDRSFFDFLFSKLKVTYDFSFIKNNGGIDPHVDALSKYMSLMLYFPDSQKEENYGTTFWSSNVPNYTNTHIENHQEIKNFKSESKILYKTPFNQNSLYIFLRNDYSWHSVEPIDISDDYIRKSININFIYKN